MRSIVRLCAALPFVVAACAPSGGYARRQALATRLGSASSTAASACWRTPWRPSGTGLRLDLDGAHGDDDLVERVAGCELLVAQVGRR